jgi:nitrogen regulatory protein PII
MTKDAMVNEQIDDATTDMLMVTVIIQPFRLDAVTLELEQIAGFGGMTVSDCRGFGHGKVSDEEDATGSERRRGLVDFTPKVKLEIAVAGLARANAVVEAIARAAHTGRPGDGKIFLWPIAHALRVRTSDVNAAAL